MRYVCICKARLVPTNSLQGKKWNIGTSNMQSEWLLDETNGSGRCTRRIHERGLFQAILLAISRAEKVIDAWYQRKGHLQASVPKVNYA